MTRLPPVHPGEILQTELLQPYGLTVPQLARAIAVPPARLRRVIEGHAPITAELALRLGRFFGLSPAFWLTLQQRYDLGVAADAMSDAIDREVTPFVSGPEGW